MQFVCKEKYGNLDLRGRVPGAHTRFCTMRNRRSMLLRVASTTASLAVEQARNFSPWTRHQGPW